MKRLIIITFAVLAAVTLNAQHLQFKGIPIDGNISDFSTKMNTAGYTNILTENTAAVFSGKFANEDATIYVLATPVTKTVWKVAVIFDKERDWHILKNRYMELKRQLTNKYGAPGDCYEYFSKPYYEGDGYEISAVRVHKCTFLSAFYAEHGIICLDIDDKARIEIKYEDALGTELLENEKQEVYSNDL